MAALRDFLLFVLRKAGWLVLAFIVLTVTGFVVFHVLPKARDYETTLMERLQDLEKVEQSFLEQLEELNRQVAEGVNPQIAIERLEKRVADHDRTIHRLEERRRGLWFYQVIEKARLDGEIEAVRLQREAAALGLRNLHESRRMRAELEARVAEVGRRREEVARQRQEIADSWPAAFFRHVRESWLVTLWILLAVALAPVVWKAFWFFVVAPFFRRLPPVRLVSDPVGEIRTGTSRKSLPVHLEPGERLLVRMGWAPQTSDREVKQTRLLGLWRAPLISYAAGLFELMELRPRKGEGSDGVALAGGGDADTYLIEIELKNHPGFVFRPRHLVAIQEREEAGLTLETRWRLFSLHSLLTGQFRYILFSGTGRIYLCGLGGLEAGQPAGSEHRIDAHLVAGFDARLNYAVRRSEAFWPYLRGRASLTDDCFSGEHGLYLRNVATDARAVQTVIEKSTGGLLNAIGKLLGF